MTKVYIQFLISPIKMKLWHSNKGSENLEFLSFRCNMFQYPRDIMLNAIIRGGAISWGNTVYHSKINITHTRKPRQTPKR